VTDRARPDPVLRAEAVTKRYGATEALRGVSFSVDRGEILGLVGANGAGKSTLTGILTGSVERTSGRLFLDGKEVSVGHVDEAREHGIEAIVQSVDQALVPELTAARNLTLPALSAGRLGRFPTRRALDDAARRIAGDRIDFDVRTPVRDLDPSQRQRLLIARALSSDPLVLILDEPTASLSIDQQNLLHGELRELARRGTAIIYITHHLGEVVALCDSVLVLRDGAVTARLEAPFTAAEIVAPMLGDLESAVRVRSDSREDAGAASRPEVARERSEVGSAAAVLEVRGVRAWPDAAPSDFTVREGEVVGITGLIGAGKTELLLQLVGASPRVSGHVVWRGREFAPRDTGEAIRAGIGFVPEERFRQGEIPGWSVAATITLPDLRSYAGALGLLSRRRELDAATRVMDALHLVASGPGAAIESLSGGNRQKAIVGRWLAASSELLIFDEPFRGVDIGARADIAAILRRTPCALVASSDPEEILEIADRVLIAANGTLVGEVDPARTTVGELTDLMTKDAAA
jgi:simple sugar transport system ATP-binding protein